MGTTFYSNYFIVCANEIFIYWLAVIAFVIFIEVLADALIGSLVEFFKALIKLLGSYLLALLVLLMILASLKDPSLASVFILLLIALFGLWVAFRIIAFIYKYLKKLYTDLSQLKT